MSDISALFTAVRRWVEQPWTGAQQMDLWQFAAFIVMVLTVAFLWQRVLVHIGE